MSWHERLVAVIHRSTEVTQGSVGVCVFFCMFEHTPVSNAEGGRLKV